MAQQTSSVDQVYEVIKTLGEQFGTERVGEIFAAILGTASRTASTIEKNLGDVFAMTPIPTRADYAEIQDSIDKLGRQVASLNAQIEALTQQVGKKGSRSRAKALPSPSASKTAGKSASTRKAKPAAKRATSKSKSTSSKSTSKAKTKSASSKSRARTAKPAAKKPAAKTTTRRSTTKSKSGSSSRRSTAKR